MSCVTNVIVIWFSMYLDTACEETVLSQFHCSGEILASMIYETIIIGTEKRLRRSIDATDLN